MADTYQPLVGIAATLIWTWRLKFLGKDIHGFDVWTEISGERFPDISILT